MTPPVSLSQAALRTSDSPISDLMARALGAPGLISLAAGFVDNATLPVEATARVAAEVLSDPIEGRRSLQYGMTRGDLRLRQQLVAHLERTEQADPRSFDDCAHRLVVTSGSQQLLYLVAEALLDPGDIILVESPTYFVFLGVLQTRGARVIGVETDDEGLRPDVLEDTLSELDARGELGRVKLIYTITEHSNPTGLSLAADRRGELVRIAHRWSTRGKIFILEDAAYRGLTFEGVEPPSVWSHDPEGETVILARTFSKTFSPGLRTGFGVLPRSLVPTILNLKSSHDFGSAHFPQQILERVLAEGVYEQQVARLATAYRRKRDVLVSALETHVGPVDPGVSWTHPTGGLYVWLSLPEGIDTGRDGHFFARCLEHGVLYVPGSLCYAGEPGPAPGNQARLTFGVAGENELIEGSRRLAAALSSCLHTVA
jgi:2-aminoadipate transaminase